MLSDGLGYSPWIRASSVRENDHCDVIVHKPGDIGGKTLPGAAMRDALVTIFGGQEPAKAVWMCLAIVQLHWRPHGFPGAGLEDLVTQ